MTARKIGIGLVLLAFADLVIALSLIIGWMWQDARKRGVSAIPYVLLTLGFGSVGPLLYLLRRDATREPQALRAGAPVRAAV